MSLGDALLNLQLSGIAAQLDQIQASKSDDLTRQRAAVKLLATSEQLSKLDAFLDSNVVSFRDAKEAQRIVDEAEDLANRARYYIDPSSRKPDRGPLIFWTCLIAMSLVFLLVLIASGAFASK